uniref:R3H-associated N-terminal domain-containing protein n=1 Tax=Eutreptiella gymnastica TaxID=73025 RepID=A0A6U7TB42_9EUGL
MSSTPASPILSPLSPGTIPMGLATYAAFKHGSSIHQRSVVYGAGNDVVMHDEISSTSESEVEDKVRRVVQPLTPINMAGREQRPLFRQRLSAGEEEGVTVERMPSKKRAGVRRRRRFANDYFLEERLQHLQHHQPQNLDDAKAQWHALFAPSNPSAYQEIFEDEDMADAIDPFLDISMEEEDRLLRKMCRRPPEPREDAIDKDCPTVRFAQIPKELRLVLRRSVDSEELPSLQTDFVQYLSEAAEGSQPPPLEFHLDGHGRLLCHAMAMYYNLISASENTHRDGVPARVTRVRHTKKSSPSLPKMHLTEYLHLVVSASGYFSYGRVKPRKKTGKEAKDAKKYRRRFATK